MNGLPKESTLTRLPPGIWPRTTQRRCVTIRFAAAKFWRGFPRLDGVTRRTSRVPRYSYVHPPATMCTDMSSPWTEAGWLVEENARATITQRERLVPRCERHE